jgi:hypothetical protein
MLMSMNVPYGETKVKLQMAPLIKFYLGLSILALSSCGYFQSIFSEVPKNWGTLTGRVKKAHTEISLEGVEISCGGVRGLTDKRGVFFLDKVEYGMQVLKAKKVGYKPYSISVVIKPNQINKLARDIELEEGTIIANSITESQTWNEKFNLIEVVSTTTVEKGVLLTIDKGVEVVFYPKVKLIIKGRLQILGEEGTPVKLRSRNEREEWLGLDFQQAEKGSAIIWTEIKHAEVGIQINNTPEVEIKNCTLEYCSSYGIKIENSTVRALENNILQNYYLRWGPVGIYLFNVSGIEEKPVSILHNKITEFEKGMMIVSVKGEVKLNIISRNHFGIVYQLAKRGTQIFWNEISHNTSFAIKGDNMGSNIFVGKNYIYSNYRQTLKEGVGGNNPENTQCSSEITVSSFHTSVEAIKREAKEVGEAYPVVGPVRATFQP